MGDLYDPVVEHHEALRRDFLAEVHEPYRAQFGSIVRRLVTKELEDWEPGALLTLTEMRLAERLASARPGEEYTRFQYFLGLLSTHRALAGGYMEWALWWDTLPEDQRETLKARRWQDLQMAEQSPTEGQLKYLRRLGHVGEITDMAHARHLIEEYVAARAGRIG